MIQAIRPLLQAAREEVELRRMQIAGGRIHAQRITVSGRGNEFRSADRGGMKKEL